MTSEEILRTNILATIREMQKSGTVGASRECLKQCTPTKGLRCGVGEYHRAFESVLNSINVKGFEIYGTTNQ
jgi:hypothetical protein